MLTYPESLNQEIEKLKMSANKLVKVEDSAFLNKYTQLYNANIEPKFAYIAAKEDGVTEPMLTYLLIKTYKISEEEIKTIREQISYTAPR